MSEENKSEVVSGSVSGSLNNHQDKTISQNDKALLEAQQEYEKTVNEME